MDFATARGALPGMTRDRFGERVTILPMKQGKMGQAVDPDRPVMTDLPVRYDVVPDIEQIGGNRERNGAAKAMAEVATISVERSILAGPIEQGDHVRRVDPISGETETYRVSSTGRDGILRLLVHLSRV